MVFLCAFASFLCVLVLFVLLAFGLIFIFLCVCVGEVVGSFVLLGVE